VDKIIQHYDSTLDNDLRFTERGIAYQSDIDTAKQASYEGNYFGYCEEKYSDQAMGDAINAVRLDLVAEYGDGLLLDIGIGSGSFLKARGEHTFGVDIDPAARTWLKENGKWSEDYDIFGAFTMWDVLEHCKDPSQYFRRMKPGALLFVSIPIFERLPDIRGSIHYRPNEHFYYFTDRGFRDYMAVYGFECLQTTDGESRAGRANILSYAFRKGTDDYGYMIGQYADIHSTRHYGASSGLYFDRIAEIIKRRNPASILFTLR